MPGGYIGRVHKVEDGVRVEFCGVIDAVSVTTIATDVRKEIKAAHGAPVIFDFTSVSFIDSVGIGWLLSFKNMPSERGQIRLLLTRDSQPGRILPLLRIDQSIPVTMVENEYV